MLRGKCYSLLRNKRADSLTLQIVATTSGVTPDLLDTVKGSRTPCTRLGSSCQVRSAEQRGYNLQTILAIA